LSNPNHNPTVSILGFLATIATNINRHILIQFPIIRHGETLGFLATIASYFNHRISKSFSFSQIYLSFPIYARRFQSWDFYKPSQVISIIGFRNPFHLHKFIYPFPSMLHGFNLGIFINQRKLLQP
jgi:hypothetical protein